MTRQHGWSDLTVSDFFCGAGGNTIGAKRAGLRVRVGLNHWQRAIDTYGENNPEVDVVERVDVSLCDPRRYPSTNIGIFSPECTTHSPAGGNKHRRPQWHPDLFPLKALDPATVRSRVTMLDVVRFTEYHRYELVVVENVVEAVRWELFPDWLRMMDNLGYHHRILSFNSMFFHPTPQSRDRIYVVFWKKGNRAPELDYSPAAPCAKCGVVEAVQAWKNQRTIGKYKRQYIYACPRCANAVTPFYYAALNALDFSLAAERIGDRPKPLKPRTMDRIRFGLEKFGNRALVIRDNMTSGLEFRVRDAGADPHFAQAASHYPMDAVVHPSPFIVNQWGDDHSGRRVYGLSDALAPQAAGGVHDMIIQPGFVMDTARSGADGPRPRGLDEASGAQTGQQTSALVMAPFMVTAGSNESSASSLDAMPTQTGTERLAVISPFMVTLRTNAAAQSMADAARSVCADGNHHAVVSGAPFIVTNRANNKPLSADEALSPMNTGNHHIVIQGAAQISLRDADAMRVAGLERELMTQGCAPQQAVLSRAPFITSHYSHHGASAGDEPLPTQGTLDKHSVVQPDRELRVDDCYFRMLQPHEIGAAMAFPAAYKVGGNKRDRVKQYGNAVTPPVMDWIIRQCAATLAPELADGAA